MSDSAGLPVVVLALWLLRRSDNRIANSHLAVREFAILPKHTEYCPRTYHGAVEFVLVRKN